MKILYILFQVAGLLIILTMAPFLLGPEEPTYTIPAIAGCILGLGLIISGRMLYVREKRKHPESNREIILKRSVIAAFILFAADAFIFDQGLIAAITLFIAIIVLLPHALYKYKDKEIYNKRLKRAAIYIFMALGVFLILSLNNKIASDRAKTLIDLCGQYNMKYHKYPERLEDLVAEFIPKIPPAKYTFLSGKFRYIYNDVNPLLMYTVTPPFGRKMYSFRSGQWSYLD